MSISTRSDAGVPYRLQFLPEALEEWQTLDESVKTVLRKIGYRLVYAVEDDVNSADPLT